MVGVARIELATPAMSTQCSTTELHAHSLSSLMGGPKPSASGEALLAALMPKRKRDFADFIGWRERNPVRPP